MVTSAGARGNRVSSFTESVVEEAALGWLEALGYSIAYGPHIAPGELAAERKDYGQVVLEDRIRQALALGFRQASGSIRCCPGSTGRSFRVAEPKVPA